MDGINELAVPPLYHHLNRAEVALGDVPKPLRYSIYHQSMVLPYAQYMAMAASLPEAAVLILKADEDRIVWSGNLHISVFVLANPVVALQSRILIVERYYIRV